MSLITVDELHAGEPPVLLDVRWELSPHPPRPPGWPLYLEGHIPGAAFVDLDTALAGPPGAGGRHPLPDADVFARSMRAAGVSGDRPVVVYDAGNSVAAARAWWLLRYFGHSDVRVLDGGFSGWQAAGYPIERGATAADPGDFVPRPGGMPLLDADAAAALARDGVLIDARAAARFRGEEEPVDPVAGHIPNAVNLPAPDLVGDDGRFAAPDDLRARFAELGADSAASVGAYCGSGVAASYEVLALSLAGIPAALYVGSWSDWITDPDRPVATGE
jgi:thiosulfate/3-mercaptopyruvate sulfurtransferase